MPMDMPPWTWASARAGLMSLPESWTLTMFRILTLPRGMSTAMDHPELRALFVETDDPSGPFGNKALGEPPSIPVAPAIRNAILQATGVALNRLPMNPQRLVEAFTAAGLIDAKGE